MPPFTISRHIEGGKQCTRLAMTWADRVSFVLTESLTIKRVAALEVLKELEGTTNDDERFDTDFALMTDELVGMLADLVKALGGEMSGALKPAALAANSNEGDSSERILCFRGDTSRLCEARPRQGADERPCHQGGAVAGRMGCAR